MFPTTSAWVEVAAQVTVWVVVEVWVKAVVEVWVKAAVEVWGNERTGKPVNAKGEQI